MDTTITMESGNDARPHLLDSQGHTALALLAAALTAGTEADQHSATSRRPITGRQDQLDRANALLAKLDAASYLDPSTAASSTSSSWTSTSGPSRTSTSW